MKKDWTYKKLGEVTTTINGLWTGKKPPFVNVAVVRNTNFTKDCKLDMTNVAYLDVEEKQFSTRKLQYGDIIIEKSGGSEKQPVGRPVLFNIKEGDYSFSNFTSTLRINNKEELDPHFLHYSLVGAYFRGVTGKMQAKTTGIHNLDFKAYLKLLIPTPSLPEQQQIVAELDLLSKMIEKQKAQIEELDKLSQSIFYDMFGDPVTNEKGWEVKRMHEIAKLSAGGDVPKENFSSDKTEEYCIPIFSNGLEKEGLYGYTNKAKVFNPSLTVAGRGVNVGMVFLRETPYYPIIRLITIEPKIIVDIRYLKKCVENLKLKGNGGAIPQLTVPMIKNEIVPLPPISLQQEFAEKIEAIELMKSKLRSSLQESEQLFNSRMDYYFN